MRCWSTTSPARKRAVAIGGRVAAALLACWPVTGSNVGLMGAGHAQFFSQEYHLAAGAYRELADREPGEPAPRVLLSKALLYSELQRLELLTTSAFRDDPVYNARPRPRPDGRAGAALMATLAEAQELCELRLAAQPRDVDALHRLSQVHALRANFQFMVKKAYFAALRNGRRARALSYRVVGLRPDFVDGMLVAGIDEYILGSLPWGLRAIIALSGYRGSKKRGAELIAKVAAEGGESRDDARALLGLLHRRERRPLEAATVFQSLADAFPGSYTWPLEAAAMRMAAGNRAHALALFREVERKRSGGLDRFDRMPDRLAAALRRRIDAMEREAVNGQAQ